MMDSVYDLVGIGFGPANLALSIALCESQEAQEMKLQYTFVEKQPHFAWHSSLLLPGSQLQVSPLKDLATMRDPTSSYTFFNYLHQQGRLAAFINRKVSTPSRREWSAYLAWAARRMEEVVEYGQEVIRVEREVQSKGQRIELFKVTTRNVATGSLMIKIAKNITVGVGGVPHLPVAFQHLYNNQKVDTIKQIVHSSTYLPSLASLEPMLRERESKRLAYRESSSSCSYLASHITQWAPLRFAVIGSGQSSAEMSLHLRKTFPNSQVKMIFRASALIPSDDSAFVNSAAFDPDRIDTFWKANTDDRKGWIEEFRRTNYSVVRSDVLDQINEQLYDQRVESDQPYSNAEKHTQFGKLEMMPNVQITNVEKDIDDGTQIRLSTNNIKSLDRNEQYTFDAVFLGTGFHRQANSFNFLEPIACHYPLLDKNSEIRKEQMGFKGEEETNQVFSQLLESGEEDAVERLRLRCRGIARDYRLVSYSSDAFTHKSSGTSNGHGSGSGSASASGSTSPTTASCASVTSTGTTLASNQLVDLSGNSFEASIFFLGGNEQTHGLADSLLSIVAHRAGELCESIIASHSASLCVDSQSTNKSSSSLAQSRTATSLSKVPIETLEEKLHTMQVVSSPS